MAIGSWVALADADAPDFYDVRGVALGDVLNIRAEPDPHAHKVGEIPPDGTCIRNLGCKGGLTFRDFTMGVARAGGGYATVLVTHPDGGKRAIFFRNGIPIGADTSEADGYHDFSARKESDLHLIRVGPERYEIPDPVILGG